MQRVCKNVLAILFCLALFAMARQGTRAQGYVLIDLGTLGGSQSFADAINEEGQISGGAYLTGDMVFHPVIWDANHVIHDLGLPSDWIGGEAFGINDLGQVTGYLLNSAGINHTFYADSNGVVDLGTAGWQNSIGQGINNSDQIAGYFWNGSSSMAFQHNGVRSLSASDSLSIPSGWTGSSAWGINNAGQVAGEGYPNSNSEQALLWDPVAGMEILQDQMGGNWGRAFAINDAGDIAGAAMTAQGNVVPYLYSDGVMSDLGTFDSSPYYEARALDSSGQQVVGFTANSEGYLTGTFLWKDGQMHNLSQLVNLPSGYVLNVTTNAGINSYGQIVTTSSADANGDPPYHAVLLEPIVVKSVTLKASSVIGGTKTVGKVTLTAPAVVNAYIQLESLNSAATVPAKVLIKAGYSSASFTIKTVAVSTSQTGQITAFDGTLKSALLTVNP